MLNVALCLVSNNGYFHYLEKFIPIFRRFNKDVDIVLELYNVPEYKLNWIKSNFSDIHVVTYYYDFGTREIERGYLTNRRVYLLDMLKLKYNYVFYADVNSIIKISLLKLISNSKEADIYIVLEPISIWRRMLRGVGPLGTKYYGEVLGGFQGFKTGDKVNEFIEHYKNLVSRKYTSWYADQEALYLSYLAYKDKLVFKLDFDYTFKINEVDDGKIFFSKGGNDYSSNLSCLPVESSEPVIYESLNFILPHRIRVTLMMRFFSFVDKIFKGLIK